MTIEQIERTTSHRPWPKPDLPWVMFQSWRNLLFAHWPVPVERLRPLVPEPLSLEEFGGSAWVGLTPFLLTDLRARGLPALPGISEFPEMNLRTYVRVADKPGIFFFSLDAGSSLAVLGARSFYRLPYFEADMRMERRGDWFHYRSVRTGGEAAFEGRYRPSGPVSQAEPGTLEHFLIERYALYVVLRSGRILRGDIHHAPWVIQGADAEVERNTVPSAHAVQLPDGEPLLHFSARQDTLIWPPVLV